MTLVTDAFTPTTVALSLGGGALIGLAAAALLGLNGRVLGVSGILNGVLDRASQPGHHEPGDLDWRLALLGGLALGALAMTALLALGAAAPVAPRSGFPAWALVAAGLLVGYGTRLGSGCTSGHGICGIARGSPRSIVATLVFMTSGVATVFLIRHVLGVLP